MSYEEPESNNLMSNPRLLTAIIVGAIGLISIVGCVAIFFIFGSRNQPPTQGTKVIQVTKIPTSTATLTPVASVTKQPTLDPNKAAGGGGGETPTPDLTATFINRPQTRAATISEIKGSVQIKSPIGGDFTTVTSNITIPAGTIILTSEDSSAKVTLTEGSIIRISSQTQVKIEQLGGTTQNPVTKLKLDFGKVWSIVGGSLGTGSFDVETPLGVASVIGSFMGTETNPTEELDIITCLEGKCKYSNTKGVQSMTTLQQLIVKKDTSLGAPTKMDTVQVNDWSPTKVSEVVTLTPTSTPTSTPTGTRTPSNTPTATGTPNATSTFNAQSTGTAAANTSVAQTSTAGANSINLTSTQNVINLTGTAGAFNLTSTVIGNSFTSTAFAATVNANSTQFQATQNSAATSTQVFVNQTSTASSLTSTAAAQPRVSVSAASSVSEGSYLAVTFNLTTAMTTTTTINATLSGGNGAQVGGSTSGSVTTGLTDTNCIADAVLQSQPVTTTATTSMSFSVQINTGSTSTTIQVPICSDTVTDSTDTLQFVVNSVSPSNVLIGTPSSATVNITDVAQPAIGFNPPSYSVAENVSGGKVTLTVKTNNGNVSSNTNVNFTLNNVSATSGLNTCPVGVDYYAITTSPVTILSGSDNATIDVGICYDADNTESAETFQATITSVGGGFNIGSNPGTVSILNSAPPTISLSSSTYPNVFEKDGVAAITVNLSTSLTSEVSIAYSTTDGTAISGATLDGKDYTSTCIESNSFPITASTGGVCKTASSIRIAPGNTSATFYLPINDDGVNESNENFIITLGAVTYAGTGPTPVVSGISNATVTIQNSSQPIASLTSFSVAEGNTFGATNATVTTGLDRRYASYLTALYGSGLTGTVASVNYAVAGTSTATTGAACGAVATNTVDYTTISSGTFTFSPGSTAPNTALTVPVCGDTVFEPDEKIDFTLSSPVNIASVNNGSLTITSDDTTPPVITLSASSATVAEPAAPGGTATTSFSVNLDKASGANIVVSYSTTNNTARSDWGDYTSASGTVTISAGSTTATIPNLTVLGDNIKEDSETFTLTIGISSGVATLGSPSTATITITDDGTDTAPQAFISVPSTNLTKNADNLITVQLTKDSGQLISVSFIFRDGDAATTPANPCTGTPAKSGIDYVFTTGSLLYNPGNPGDVSKQITMHANSVSATKCVVLELSGSTNLQSTPFLNDAFVGTAAPLLKAFFIQP